MTEIKYRIDIDAKYMRAIAEANNSVNYLLSLIRTAAANGFVVIKVPSLFLTDQETILGELGYSVTHHNSPNGVITEISW